MIVISLVFTSISITLVMKPPEVKGEPPFTVNRQVSNDPDNFDQYEPSIAVDPSGVLYVAWEDQRNVNSDIYFANSSDGGSTWTDPNVRVNTDPIGSNQINPSLVGDSAGNLYLAWQDNRSGDDYNISFANSTNGGQNWSDPNIQINTDQGAESQGNPALAVDSSGTVYAVWEDFRNGDWDIYFAKSSNGGMTWTDPNVRVSNGTLNMSQRNPTIAVDAGGDIYVTWEDTRNGLANYDIYFSKSIDGGVTWMDENVMVSNDTTNAIQRYPSIAVNSTSGAIFVVWQDHRNLNADIYFSRSTDGGTTWSKPNKQINDDGTLGQQSPCIAVDSKGVLHVVWYDYRKSGSLGPDIFYAVSSDEGATWTDPNIRVNDDSGPKNQRKPSIVVDSNDLAYVAWEDDRINDYDIWFTHALPPLRIYDIKVQDITDTSARITWKSDNPANSTVEYGFSIAYGFSTTNNTLVTFHSIDLENLEPGRFYHFRVISYNDSVNFSMSRDFTFTTKFRVDLVYRWNMISIPLNQTNPNLGKVLESISGDYLAVRWYDVTDPADPWKNNHTEKEPTGMNDLKRIDRFMSIWIYIKNPFSAALYVDGKAPEPGYINQVPLRQGWNFVGYPSVIERNQTNFNLPTGVKIVQHYNASSGQWESWDPGSYTSDDLNIMKPGQGFWIYYKGLPTTWDIEYTN